MKRHAFSLTIACMCLLQGLASAQVGDSYVGARGTRQRVTVKAMTRNEVTMVVNATDQKVPVNEIKDIRFGDEPMELQRARDQVRAGQFEAARSELMKLDPAILKRDFMKQDHAFLLAFAEARLAIRGQVDKNSAAGRLVSFVDSNPQNYHFFQATMTLADLATAMGRFDIAAQKYAIVSGAPWPEVALPATVQEARVLIFNNKHADALKKYDQVLQAKLDKPEVQRMKRMAEIGRAVCMAATGKASEGKATVEAIVKAEDFRNDKELFARAYNALGNCYLAMNQPKDALLAFLHVHLLFDSTPDAHAEALYHLNKLWNSIKKPDRANRARTLLKDRYAGSIWANKT